MGDLEFGYGSFELPTGPGLVMLVCTVDPGSTTSDAIKPSNPRRRDEDYPLVARVVASLRAARRAPARWSRWAPVRSSRPPVIASSRRRVRALLVNLQGWSEEVTFGVALKVIFSGGRRS
jgi:hypothetical protein